MDADDFPTSPAKRQKTDSPQASRSPPQSIETPSGPGNDGSGDLSSDPQVTGPDPRLEPEPEPSSISPNSAPEPGLAQEQKDSPGVPDSNSLLDALMLQVEAEATRSTKFKRAAHERVTSAVEEVADNNGDMNGTVLAPSGHASITPMTNGPEIARAEAVAEIPIEDHMDLTNGPEKGNSKSSSTRPEVPLTVNADANTVIPTAGNAAETLAIASEAQASTAHAIPTDETDEPEPDGEGAEWEIDSSPYESSSDSDSSSDTTSSDEDSDEDADGDYAMLDPEEAARILMQGDGGSDDEGARPREKADGAPLRTANERLEQVIPKPDIVVTEEMKIEELGNVEWVVESTVVIKAKTSGEYRVLETGSLLCLQDRSVIGVVADLIGRVEEPRYTVRFTNDKDIEEAGVSANGTTIFYVPEHSTFVFTQPLKNVKGSDASNFHDEEVGEDEMEFSDDEAEAEHKRQMKLRRQGRRLPESGRGRGGQKSGKGSHRRGGSHPQNTRNEGVAYSNGSLEMNYDDVVDGGDDGYTPLQRPANLTDMMTKGEPDWGMRHPLPPPPSLHAGRGDFGNRSRGRGHGRGGRGGYRHHHGSGGLNESRGQTSHSNNNDGSNGYRKGFSQQQNAIAPLPNLNLPTTPSITPHNVTYPPMTPSPITPLPTAQFNFPPPPGFPFMPQSIPGYVPAFSHNFPHQQQYQQHQALQNNDQMYQIPAQNPASQMNFTGPWANNPAIAAALQRQVEEQRRNQGH